MVFQKKEDIRIFLVSFTILFLELILIRWVSTEIRIFAYLNNLVILACFLGIGLGCYISKKRHDLSITVLMVSVLIVIINLPFVVSINGHKVHMFNDIPLLLGSFTDSVIWVQSTAGSTFLNSVLGISATMIIFFILLFIFVPLGQIIGRALDEHPNTIKAYSINIIASVLGIWLFSCLSFLYSKPWVWFSLFVLIIFVTILLFEKYEASKMLSVALLALLIAATMFMPPIFKTGIYTTWSPYQKLEIYPLKDTDADITRGYYMAVNNTDHMFMLDLSDSFVKEHPAYFNYNMRKFSQYDIPYLFKKDAKDVLIVGAGGGNDAAGALRNGAERIDAVEIDPAINILGSIFHPERPYSDPKVHMIIDDARAFFKKANKKYDLISFGLLDAHTLSSNYNNMRIDHYVYTMESFKEAKRLLKEDGMLTVIFMAHRPWIAARIYNLLKENFRKDPLTLRIQYNPFGYGGVMFIVGNSMNNINNIIKNNPELKQFVSKNTIDIAKIWPIPVMATTDDWPYLYLEKPAIPKMHLSVIFILLLIFILTKRYVFPKTQALNPHFFFLGAAFLLLEFQNISKTTLLFGSTWLVNAFTISAILIMSLLANLFVYYHKINNIKLVYTLLLIYLLGMFILPLDIFNRLPYIQKSALVSVILNLPVFFSGIICINSFKAAKHKDFAFGSNIMGAAAGGLLESASFVVGIKVLLLAVIVFYFLSLVFRKDTT